MYCALLPHVVVLVEALDGELALGVARVRLQLPTDQGLRVRLGRVSRGAQAAAAAHSDLIISGGGGFTGNVSKSFFSFRS